MVTYTPGEAIPVEGPEATHPDFLGLKGVGRVFVGYTAGIPRWVKVAELNAPQECDEFECGRTLIPAGCRVCWISQGYGELAVYCAGCCLKERPNSAWYIAVQAFPCPPDAPCAVFHLTYGLSSGA